MKWNWTTKEQEAFDTLKEKFTKAPVLGIPNDEKPFCLETDASDYGIGAVLSQEGNDGKMHPIAFYSTRLNKAEQIYKIYNKEMLAVIKALKKWRHHLMGAKTPVKVYSDHKNLTYFKKPQELEGRQARWYMKPLEYNLELIHQPAAKSARSDTLSRNPSWKENDKESTPITFIKPEWDLSPTIQTMRTDPLLKDIKTEIQSKGIKAVEAVQAINDSEVTQLKTSIKDWVPHEGLLLYQGKVYIPNDDAIKKKVLQRSHDSPGAGHPGREKMLDLVNRQYWWPSITKYVHQYVDGCIICQQNKILPRKPNHLMGRHKIPDQPWEVISVDFITDLPQCQGKDAILTVVDYNTKQGHFIPTVKETSSSGLYQLYMNEVWKHHGTPQKIVSDRGPQFASEFTKALQIVSVFIFNPFFNHFYCPTRPTVLLSPYASLCLPM